MFLMWKKLQMEALRIDETNVSMRWNIEINISMHWQRQHIVAANTQNCGLVSELKQLKY